MTPKMAIRSVRVGSVLLFVSGCFLLSSCGRTAAPSHEAEYPERPLERPYFLNTTSIRTIDEVAIGDLQRARKLTGIDFTMVFLRELPSGVTAENYAAKLFTRWKIGRETANRGVLFLFVESEGTLKIEVGYELEGVFPDGFVGSFQDSLKHYFAGRYFGDVVSGMITAMVRRAQNEDPGEILANFRGSLPSQEAYTFQSGGAGVLESGFFYEKESKLRLIRELDPATRELYQAAAGPREVIRRYVESLSKGYNDPYLGLLTEGSQYMRLEYPKSEGFQRSAARDCEGDYELKIERDLAVARFSKPEVMPLLLRRSPDGLWKIDVTKSWAYSQSSSDLKVMNPAFGDHPWIFAWPDELRTPEFPATPGLLPADFPVAAEITRLEALIKSEPQNAAAYFALADIFYFECYWIRAAMDAIEKGLELEPTNSAYRKRLLTFSYRFPDLSRAEHHYDMLLKYDPSDFDTTKRYRNFLKNYRNDPAKREALKALLSNKPLSRTPYILEVEAAKYQPFSFLIPPRVQAIEVEFWQFRHNWHPKWVPFVQVILSDGEREKHFGFAMTAAGDREPSVVSIADTEGIATSLLPTPAPTVALGEKRRITLRWNAAHEVTVEMDDQIIARGVLPYEPVRLTTFARSCNMAVALRWSGTDGKMTRDPIWEASLGRPTPRGETAAVQPDRSQAANPRAE